MKFLKPKKKKILSWNVFVNKLQMVLFEFSNGYTSLELNTNFNFIINQLKKYVTSWKKLWNFFVSFELLVSIK